MYDVSSVKVPTVFPPPLCASVYVFGKRNTARKKEKNKQTDRIGCEEGKERNKERKKDRQTERKGTKEDSIIDQGIEERSPAPGSYVYEKPIIS